MFRSIYKSVVKPDGDRYNNIKKIGDKEFIENSVINEKDFRFTNRVGVIVAPSRTTDVLQKGDKVIVKHNVFRKFNNIHGDLVDSGNYVKENTFTCFDDEMLAYNRDDKWIVLRFSCFIKPKIKKQTDGFVYETNVKEELVGTIFVNNPQLEEYGLKVGDEILFLPDSEYEFNINGEIVYHMKAQDVIAKL